MDARALVGLGLFGIAAYVIHRQSQQSQTATPFNVNAPDLSITAPILSAPAIDTTGEIMGTMQSPSVYQTSPNGLNVIENFEGKSYVAYDDGFGNITIGIGHLIVPGDGLNTNSVLTDAQIAELFANDVADAENVVKSMVTVPLTQGMFDALVDFVFQFGEPKFASSTLLRLVNSRNYDSARSELTKWVHAGNPPVVVSQLVQRRAADAAMFV